MLNEWMTSGMLEHSITTEDNMDQLLIIKLLGVSLVAYYGIVDNATWNTSMLRQKGAYVVICGKCHSLSGSGTVPELFYMLYIPAVYE